MEQARRIKLVAKAGLVAGLTAAGIAGVLLAGTGGASSLESFCSLLFIPVLLASFFFGKPGGLLVALLASLAAGSRIVADPAFLEDHFGRHILVVIVLYNGVALITSWLAEREKLARQRYQGLFENVGVGIGRVSSHGVILEANSTLAAMVGHDSRLELLGKPLHGFLAHDADFEAWLRKAHGSGVHAFDFEAVFKSRDGELFHGRMVTRPVHGDQPGMELLEITLEDVTLRHRAEADLHAAHKRLEDIIEFLPAATFVVDGEGRVIAWNKAVEEMTGVSKERMLGRRGYAHAEPFYGERRPLLVDLVGKPDNEISRYYEEVDVRGRVVSKELYLPKLYSGKGGWAIATASALFDQQGRVAGAIESVRDISQRKRAEEALKEAESRYRLIFEDALEGIFQCATDGRFLHVNPAQARIFGYESPSDLMASVGDFRRLIMEPEERDGFFRQIHGFEVVKGREMRFIRSDGKVIWLLVSARLVRDTADGSIFYEGFTVDVTLSKLAEEALKQAHDEMEERVRLRTRELEEANRQLKAMDEMKSAFLSSASHELRTPLTSVLGFARLIERDFAKSFEPLGMGDGTLARRAARIKKNLAIISQEGGRLTRLINDLLDLAKIESGRMDFKDEEIEVADLVNRAMDAVRGQFVGKPEVSLQTDLEPDLPKLVADSDRLVQVLVNLLSNAVKFTHKGMVRAEVFNGPEGSLAVRVVDTGVGIPDSDLEKVFERFHQVVAEDDGARGQGTGLGLTISRQIVERYGGRIWAESKQGAGSIFTFLLPPATIKR